MGANAEYARERPKAARNGCREEDFLGEEAELLRFLRSEQASYYRGDYEAFSSHWHHGPEVRRILSGPQVGTRLHVGWAELEEKFKEGFRQFPQNYDARALLRWDNIQIQISHDMAWVTYDQVALKHIPRMHVSPLSHETKIVHRIGGAWKLVCLIVVAPGLGRDDIPRIELDPDGCVIAMNDLARDRIGGHPGLAISVQKPRARHRRYDPGLQTAIKRFKDRLATNLPRGFLDENAATVPLGDDDHGTPMFCWIGCEQERIILSFDDQARLRTMLDQAGESFALSPSQVKVAGLLANGHELAEAATALGVSVNTVRTQVRRMFEKTQTHNRAGLISRLLNVQAHD